MKLQQSLKLFAAGAIALGATASLGQPSQACPTGNTDANCHSQTYPVYPTLNAGNPCPSTPGNSCKRPPVVYPQKPSCQSSGCVQVQPPVVNPPIASDSFYCGKDYHGRPTTFVSTPGGVLPIVRWVSDYFSPSGYDPG